MPGLPRGLGALRVVLKTCAECPDHFRAGFAKRLELRLVNSLEVLAQVFGNLRQLTPDVLTMDLGIG